MILFIVLIIVILFILFVIVLMAVGLCIGIAYLLTYFIPTLDLAGTLVPAAILATVLIVMIASVFKFWITKGIGNAYIPVPGYYDDEDELEPEPEPEPPTVTKIRSYPNKKNRR